MVYCNRSPDHAKTVQPQHSHAPLLHGSSVPHAACCSHILESLGSKRFCQYHVRQLMLGVDVVDVDTSACHVFEDEVVSNIYVLGPRMVCGIVCKCDCSLVVIANLCVLDSFSIHVLFTSHAHAFRTPLACMSSQPYARLLQS